MISSFLFLRWDGTGGSGTRGERREERCARREERCASREVRTGRDREIETRTNDTEKGE